MVVMIVIIGTASGWSHISHDESRCLERWINSKGWISDISTEQLFTRCCFQFEVTPFFCFYATFPSHFLWVCPCGLNIAPECEGELSQKYTESHNPATWAVSVDTASCCSAVCSLVISYVRTQLNTMLPIRPNGPHWM